MSSTGRYQPEMPEDEACAAEFGAYASYETSDAPTRFDFHGQSPSEEIDRLLDQYVNPNASLLDIGCGAGFTLCRVAAAAKQVCGIDLSEKLVMAAQARILKRGLTNAQASVANVSDPDCAASLPLDTFNLVLSRRGPFLTSHLMPTLRQDALFVVEMFQDYLGLKTLFGRTPILPTTGAEADPAVSHMASLDMVPVSIRTFWFEEWFQDEDHLGRYLSQGANLSNWWMDPCPFDPIRDREALHLYAKYMRSSEGIRLQACRKIYVFRRQKTQFYPIAMQL